MKLNYLTVKKYKWTKIIIAFVLLFLLESCATHQMQLNKSNNNSITAVNSDTLNATHTFFLIGDAGNADDTITAHTLKHLEKRIQKADKNSTLIFLGDNIYPVGMPTDKKHPEYKLAELKLNNQLDITQNFKGKTHFISGNHDWYSGWEGLEKEAKMVNDYLKDKNAFQPKNLCAINDLKINSNTVLITIDSQWFLEDWENHPKINDNCEIKTREAFFEEFESLLNKNQDKIKIIAIHHPLVSNGTHGGQFSMEKQLFPFESKFPLPVIGSFINLLRKTSGASPQDLQNKVYQSYIKRMTTLLQGHDNTVLVSGHDHNLQYIEKNNLVQIISGSGSKTEAARAVGKNDFSFGGNGYAVVKTDAKNQVHVTFYGIENDIEKVLWQKTIHQNLKSELTNYPESFPKTIEASVYTKEMTQKSWMHNFFFGKHYRSYFSQPIVANTVNLDTLFGGLKPTRAGGGHQSKSLRLVDNNGKEYVMRALKKSASRFLQSVAFKDQYVEKEFEKTYAESFLLDFYTTSHPYTPFVVGDLAEKVGVFHSNPILYYIPKQNALGKFNENFGDELYMVEERPDDSQKELESFGKPNAIISTDDLLKKLQKILKKLTN